MSASWSHRGPQTVLGLCCWWVKSVTFDSSVCRLNRETFVWKCEALVPVVVPLAVGAQRIGRDEQFKILGRRLCISGAPPVALWVSHGLVCGLLLGVVVLQHSLASHWLGYQCAGWEVSSSCCGIGCCPQSCKNLGLGKASSFVKI